MRKYVIISIGAAITFVLGGILVPLFQFLPFSALRAIALAPIYSGCAWMVLKRVDSKFTLTLFGIILGALLSIFTPWLLPISIGSAIISELFIYDEFKVIMFPALQFPMMWIATMGWEVHTFMYWAGGLITILGVGLGYGGLLIAQKINERISRVPK